MATFELDASSFDALQQAIQNYGDGAEDIINDVLHNEGSQLLQASIQRLIPVSGRSWRGKKRPARTAKSLKDIKSNLAVTITTTSNYQYLYFPDDGSNTESHAGNQQFFKRGAENEQENIINLCITRLTEI